jgi:hypothetical protein
MKNAINPALNPVAPAGGIERLHWMQRRKLFEAFMLFRQGAGAATVLEVALSGRSSGRADGVGHLRAWSKAEQKSLIMQHALDLAKPRLPYPDRAFDWVFCSEVIEHADSRAQETLVAECYRVAHKGVFLATANRRHPIEFNSMLPFVHWLPFPIRSRILRWTGRARWAGLTLLDGPALYALAAALPGAPDHDVGHKRVFGIKAHFFLMISKEP